MITYGPKLLLSTMHVGHVVEVSISDLIAGTSNSTNHFGRWIALEVISFGQQLQITKIVTSRFNLKL